MIPDYKLQKFFDFAKERYEILLRRQGGQEPPWTTDYVLKNFYFCNIFREDDKTTIWIRENLRNELSDSPHVIFVMALARYINRIESLERIKFPMLEPMDPQFWKNVRNQLRGQEPLCNGAYVIRSTDGFTKLDGIIHQLMPLREAPLHENCQSLQKLHKALCNFHYVGGFMAYEIVTDVRHTSWLRNAPDIMTWAHAGPGATRGLTYLVDLPLKNTRNQEHKKVKFMREILSRVPDFWPQSWPKWEMREVEHTLCEYDKYQRGLTGARLKRKYPQ